MGELLCVANQNLIECWAVCTRPVDANGLGLSAAATARILGRIEAAVVRLNDEKDGVYLEWKAWSPYTMCLAKMLTTHAWWRR